MSSAAVRKSTLRERQNYYIHSCFIRNDYRECLKTIENQLHQCNGQSEYPLYIKGLILRQQGRIDESLIIFQAALCLNPTNINNIKQVGQSLYLLGKHKEALAVFEEAEKINSEDRMVWFSKGICYKFLKSIDLAIECFETSNSIQKHEDTYNALGDIYSNDLNDITNAMNVYMDAIDAFPENSNFLTKCGLLYIKQNNATDAFEHLGNSLSYNNTDPTTILAAGSIIQNNGDNDVALTKYRIAMVHTPHNAELWSNIGLCFFGKNKLIGSVACLKRAHYLSPFDGRINYNLGVVHMHMEQFASAFHYFSASINLQKVPNLFPTREEARCYTYLAVALAHLDDYSNSFAAYDKSIELSSCNNLTPDPMTHLNYAISLTKRALEDDDDDEDEGQGNSNDEKLKQMMKAKEQMSIYENTINTAVGAVLKSEDSELDEQYLVLKNIFETL